MAVAEPATGRVLRGLLRLLLVLWCWGSPADFLTVETGKNQSVLLNDNATISCKVPGSTPLNTNITGIIWYLKPQAHGAEHEVFEMYGKHRKAFRPGASVSLAGMEKGDFSLHLPGVQLSDAGEYRCKVVVTPEEARGKGFLNVWAFPECTLFQEQTMAKGDGGENILCKASGFYPKDVSIKWYAGTQENPQGQEISEGITTGPAIKDKDGTYNITSRVRPEHNASTYQCVISYKSLTTFCRVNLTLSQRGSEIRNAWTTTDTYITVGCIVAGIIGLICYCKRYCSQEVSVISNTSRKLFSKRLLQQEETGELELCAYTKVHSLCIQMEEHCKIGSSYTVTDNRNHTLSQRMC